MQRILVVWSFEDTDFEAFQYEEAREAGGLPNVVRAEIDEEEVEVEDFLTEKYGFEVESWEYDD